MNLVGFVSGVDVDLRAAAVSEFETLTDIRHCHLVAARAAYLVRRDGIADTDVQAVVYSLAGDRHRATLGQEFDAVVYRILQ